LQGPQNKKAMEIRENRHIAVAILEDQVGLSYGDLIMKNTQTTNNIKETKMTYFSDRAREFDMRLHKNGTDRPDWVYEAISKYCAQNKKPGRVWE